MAYKKSIGPSIHAKFMAWRTEFLDELESEEWLSSRDASFELGGFLQSCPPDEYPHTFFNYQSRAIDICLEENAIQGVLLGFDELARWQIAHECVHLIDPYFDSHPGPSQGNVLEEGIASWYQDEKVPGRKRSGPNRERYEKAKSWVKTYVGEDKALLGAVRALRSEGRRIMDITPQDLIRVASFLPKGFAYQLTRPFGR